MRILNSDFARKHPAATTFLAAGPLLTAYSVINHITAPSLARAGFGSEINPDQIACFSKMITSLTMLLFTTCVQTSEDFSNKQKNNTLSDAMYASALASVAGDLLRTSTKVRHPDKQNLALTIGVTAALFAGYHAPRNPRKSCGPLPLSFFASLAVTAIASQL